MFFCFLFVFVSVLFYHSFVGFHSNFSFCFFNPIFGLVLINIKNPTKSPLYYFDFLCQFCYNIYWHLLVILLGGYAYETYHNNRPLRTPQSPSEFRQSAIQHPHPLGRILARQRFPGALPEEAFHSQAHSSPRGKALPEKSAFPSAS